MYTLFVEQIISHEKPNCTIYTPLLCISSSYCFLVLPVFVFINVYPGHTTCMCSLIVGRERHCPINWYISDLNTIRNSKRQIPLRWDVIEYGQSKIVYVYSSIFIFRVLLCIFEMCLCSVHELIDKSRYYMSHVYTTDIM
jgi:hypothetical protein